MDSRCGFPCVQFLSISNVRKQLLFNPCISPPELAIQSRDQIPIIAACFSRGLKSVQALYKQVTHSQSLTRQMLSIASLPNRKDLARFCLEQGARLGTIDIYNIHLSIISGNSFTTCKLLVAKGLDINRNLEFVGDILTAAVERNNLAWVRSA